MKRRKLKSGETHDLKSKSWKTMACSSCGNVIRVDTECESVLCSSCVQKRIPVDPKLLEPRHKTPTVVTIIDENGEEKQMSAKKPKGWWLMKEFVDADGKVYQMGVEIPELKGTKPISDVDAIRKLQKEKSAEKKAKKAARIAKKMAKREKQLQKEKKKKEKEKKNKFFSEE